MNQQQYPQNFAQGGQYFQPDPPHQYGGSFANGEQSYPSFPAGPYHGQFQNQQHFPSDSNATYNNNFQNAQQPYQNMQCPLQSTPFPPTQDTLSQQSTKIITLTRENQTLIQQNNNLVQRNRNLTQDMSTLNQQFSADQSQIWYLNQQLGDMTKVLRDEQVRGQDAVRRIRELEAEERRVKAKHLLELQEGKRELAKVKKEGFEFRNEAEQSMAMIRNEHEEEMRKIHEQNEGRMSKLVGKMVVFVLLVLVFNHTRITSLKTSRTALKTDLDSLRISHLVALSQREQLSEHLDEQTYEWECRLYRLDNLEQRFPDLEAGTEYAVTMRLGFLRSGRSGAANYEHIKRRNRAAHDGNMELDQALIRLGYLSPEEIGFCNERYGVDIQQYVGSPRQTEVLNMHASIGTELLLQKDLNEELEIPLARFQELERDLWRFHEMLERNPPSQENVQDVFEANADIVPAIIEEMREIVKLFQKGKKRDCKHSGW
ncbi:hypothetical protein L207DRAFT_586692 [Hyaloscypha variabilis F]|uniref:Uncharacterized protein n=1 Tax=Hyaloscypha variabilis (strain UAMH 11265 / GT02V1 / F) TaxID=1149755 RepID=A0A2J6REV6_HYAVF|nr:hypothetical protein L207DRAFT_586692 [Hyaloscypha variabilis F]